MKCITYENVEPMTPELSQLEKTRRAILDALAEVIVESGGFGFSVQQVADRAGVTHRTVYNHFPTREALNDALAVHVEQELGRIRPGPPIPSSLDGLAPVVQEAYGAFGLLEVHVRAYVMLMIASRAPAEVTRERTSALEELIRREVRVQPPLTPRGLTAAVRMFLSSTGWHLLTEHFGLTTEEAATTAVWATRKLLEGATPDGAARDSTPTPHDEARGA